MFFVPTDYESFTNTIPSQATRRDQWRAGFGCLGVLWGGNLGGGMKQFFFHHYLVKIPILTDIFQMG